jgi:hypothetical protein
MNRRNADAGDVAAHTIGLGYDEAALATVEAAEEHAGQARVTRRPKRKD